MNSRRQVTMTRVIDGDTVELAAQTGMFGKPQKERVRLYGIDAPESSQTGGKESTKHLEKLIGRHRRMWMNVVDTDRYGRTVGLIYRSKDRPEDSYNYMMVRDGQARSYMARGQDRKTFGDAEKEAAQRGHGIWKTKKATTPWDYRKAERSKKERKEKLKLVLILILVLTVIVGTAALYLKLGLPLPQQWTEWL